MGLFNMLFGSLVGYSALDIAKWQKMFPDGVERHPFGLGRNVSSEKVSILDAIRHIQNSYGQSANDSCWKYASQLERGECVPTGCGKYFYVHPESRQRAKSKAETQA